MTLSYRQSAISHQQLAVSMEREHTDATQKLEKGMVKFHREEKGTDVYAVCIRIDKIIDLFGFPTILNFIRLGVDKR